MRRILLVLAFFVLSVAGAAQTPQRLAPWNDEIVKLAESLPVQEGGRVKPLLTHASYMLLRFNGKRGVTTPAGEKLGPAPWLLDLLFFPEASEGYPVFLVADEQAIEAMGLSVEGKKKRDRYSFHELRMGVSKLFELAGQYSQIEEKERSSVQQQVVLLAMNVDEYLRVMTHMDFARTPLRIGPGSELRALFGGAETAAFSDVLGRVAELRELQSRIGKDPARAEELGSVTKLLHATMDITSGTETLTLMPPAAGSKAEDAWLSPAALMAQAFRGEKLAPQHLEMLRCLEAAARARNSPPDFQNQLTRFDELARSLAAPRGEDQKLALEVGYYRMGLLGHSQTLFVLAFLLVAGLWLRPRSRWLYRSAAGVVTLATLLVVAVIVMRCMIRGRPPVSTLYETLLFVTAMGAATALVAELLNRQRIALSAAAVLGMIGLFVANGYEMLDKRDTMPSLVAVLDTNFWLATHVTAITVGYSAGVLAALLANFYLVARMFGWGKGEQGFQHGLARTIYGVLGFGLIFSVVGTILGGVWANESWGRFWGWDPKENGALLIVLAQLVILHSRMAGMLREFGFCMATAFGGIVIAFSWFGVNLLGVGLHSYGFTSGVSTALTTYYAIQGGLLLVAGAHWQMQRVRAKALNEARLSAAGAAGMLLLALGVLGGCASEKLAPSVYVHPNADFSLYKEVAVLPLENLTSERFAADRVRELLVVELSAQGLFAVIEPGEVNRVMRLRNIDSPTALGPDAVKELGAELKAQALLTGSVIEYREQRSGTLTSPEVALSLRLIDVESGLVVWSVTDARTGLGVWTRLFGVGEENQTGAARKLIRDLLQKLE